MPQSIYVVPVVDVGWENFAPLNPSRGFVHDPPPIEICLQDIRDYNALMRRITGGKFVYSPHTGMYADLALLGEPFLQLYREAVSEGAEVTVHPHEQIAGVGVRYHEADHMAGVITSSLERLRGAGLECISFRGGHYAYMNYFTPLFENLGLLIDYSCRPGFVGKAGFTHVSEATAAISLIDWTDAPFSAYMLSRADYRKSGGPDVSRIFEIPIGSDGLGNDDTNCLYVDRYDGRPVWDAIVARAEEEGRPQFVHMLCHTFSAHQPGQPEQFARFVDYARQHQGVVVTGTECRERWREVMSEVQGV